MTPGTVLVALLVATLAVLAGNLFGRLTPGLRGSSLPGAVLGGLLALLAGPELVAPEVWPFAGAEMVSSLFEVFASLPGAFITVVFACLMLGRPVGAPGDIWQRARPLVVMGHVIAWGQYCVGFLLVGAVLGPLFGLDPLAGPLIAIGFQGGHGTAAGLGPHFDSLGFEAGEGIAMGIATVGVLTGVVGGPFLAQSLHRRFGDAGGAAGDGQAEAPSGGDGEGDAATAAGAGEAGGAADSADPAGPADVAASPLLEPDPLTGRLTVHLGLVALVIAIGAALLHGLQTAERALRPEDGATLVSDFLPLFSVVLITGMLVQIALQALGWGALFDRALFERIGAFALDMVIFGAMATLPLGVLGEHWIALLVLGLGGVLWNLAVLFLVGRHVYRSPWYAFGVGDFGGGTATTACGLMLVDVADPDGRADARSAYADKQPFYEPLMGGGLVTAVALPTVATLGLWGALAIAGSVLALCLVVALRMGRA